MTVSTTGSKISLAGNNSTTVFSFPFAFPGGITASQAAQELSVSYVSPSGVTTPVTYGFGASNYQLQINAPISPNPTSIGGNITYFPAGVPIPLGSFLVVQRTLPALQTTSLQNQGTLWQQVIEQSLDYLTMIEQQVTNQIGQAILVPASDPAGLNYTIPSATARANQILSFDANGNVVTTTGTGLTTLPPGAQTVSAPWTFTGIPPIWVKGLAAEIREQATNANPFYSGTISAATSTTVTLSANPTNVWTGQPCCNNDSTILNAVIIVAGQAVQIGSYVAATRLVTSTGSFYNTSGALIPPSGAAFNPIPSSGAGYTIGRNDYGSARTVVDRGLVLTQAASFATPAASVSTDPYTAVLETERFNQMTGETSFRSGIGGDGFIQNFVIATNSFWNSDPFFLNGQTPANFQIFTLWSSGDSGNTANYPSTYPVTYGPFNAFQISPHTYSAGVLQSWPRAWIGFRMYVGMGIAAGTVVPDSPLELRHDGTAAKVPPVGTMLHIVPGTNPGTPAFAAPGSDIICMDAYGANSNLVVFRQASGAPGAEAATTTGMLLGGIAGIGYDTAYTGTRAGINLFTSQAWGPGANGTYIGFVTTQSNTTIPLEAARFQPSGGFTVGAATDLGAGSIHTTGPINAGTSVTAASFIGGTLTIGGGGQVLTATTPLLGGAPVGGSPTLGTNAPVAGTPTKWIQINDGGTPRSIPAW